MADVKVRYKKNPAFAKAILRGAVAADLCQRAGKKIQSKASSMYGASNYGLKMKVGANRVRAIVYTGDRYAIRSNFKHNTLRKSVK